MTQTPTDALRLVNPHRDITENLRQAAVDLHPWFVGDAKTFSVDCALPAYLNDAADEIERLRAAAPASPLPGGGWQDISTAPALTDHMKPVLLFWQSSGVGLGYYDIDDDYRNRPKWWVSPAAGWRCFGDQCIPVNQQDCTHWMPLPAAPTGEPK